MGTKTEAASVLSFVDVKTYTDDLQNEKDRRKEHFDSMAAKWRELMESYRKALKKEKFEGISNHLYLDSECLVTIGSGHLIGYNSSEFQEDSEKIRDRLLKELKQIKIRDALRSIDSPYECLDNLKITTEEIVTLFESSQYLRLGLLEVLSLPFGVSNDTGKKLQKNDSRVPETSINDIKTIKNERKELLTRSFINLIKVSIMQRARFMSFPSLEKPNSFFPRSFYSLEYNALALKEDIWTSLHQEDIAVKVGELLGFLTRSGKKLSDYSFPAQLGVLDLMYTGSIPSFKKAVIDMDYSKLIKAVPLERTKNSKERNQWVANKFKEAESLSKEEKEKAKAQ